MFYIYKLTKHLKLTRLKLVWVPILLLSSLAIAVSNSLVKNQSAKAPAAVTVFPVETTSIKPVDSYQEPRTYTGEIVARRSSELGFERSGQLVFVAVDEGDRVKIGQPLARLDTSSLEAERQRLLQARSQAVAQLQELQTGPRIEKIAAARATARQIEAQLKLSQTKQLRRETLYAQGAISQEQLDEIAFEASTLNARLDEAKSNLAELLAGTRTEQIAAQVASVKQLNASIASIEIDLAKSTIKAPFTGIISQRLIDEGTVVASGQPILRLVEDKGLEARIGVPVISATALKLGSKQLLRVGHKSYAARVASVQPELDASTRTLSIVLTLEQLTASVMPGQIARLELLETISTSGYWLPTTALIRGTRGLWSCYVMAKDHNNFRVERRDVEIMHTESDRVLARGTLLPKDQVIISGTHKIVPGQLVHQAKL